MNSRYLSQSAHLIMKMRKYKKEKYKFRKQERERMRRKLIKNVSHDEAHLKINPNGN